MTLLLLALAAVGGGMAVRSASRDVVAERLDERGEALRRLQSEAVAQHRHRPAPPSRAHQFPSAICLSAWLSST